MEQVEGVQTPGTQPGRPDVGAMAATATDLSKVYGEGNTQVVALDHVDIGFAAGRLTAIMGPSGSGKSTLLHCMAGLDSISGGEVRIGDTLISDLSDQELTLLRRQRMGFIFQAFNLVPTLSAEENITLPLDKPREIDHVILREQIAHGERVRDHVIEGLVGDQWVELAALLVIASLPAGGWSGLDFFVKKWLGNFCPMTGCCRTQSRE